MQEFTPEFFEINLDFSKGAELVDTLFTAINGGSQYTIPDNVQTVERDIDLEEIEAEKRSKRGKFLGRRRENRLRLFYKGLSIGLSYQEIMIMQPGDIIQMWLYKVGETSNGKNH